MYIDRKRIILYSCHENEGKHCSVCMQKTGIYHQRHKSNIYIVAPDTQQK